MSPKANARRRRKMRPSTVRRPWEPTRFNHTVWLPLPPPPAEV